MSNSLRYPIGMRIDDTTDYMSISIVEYRPPGISSGSGGNFFQDTSTRNIRANRKRVKTSIILPMPVGLVDTNGVSWDEDSANAIELKGAEAFQKIVKSASIENQSAIEALQQSSKTAGQIIKEFGGALDENTRENLLRYFGAKAVGVFSSNLSPQSLIGRATGQALNPNMELLFKGVQLRSFPFAFTLTPRSRDEGQMCKSIIRTFKTAMAAKTTIASDGATSGSRGIFIQSPDDLEVQFRRGNRPHPFLYTMKPMALKNMNVSYSDTGAYTTYEDSTPVKMTMSLSFTELNPIYREDYGDNFSRDGVGY